MPDKIMAYPAGKPNENDLVETNGQLMVCSDSLLIIYNEYLSLLLPLMTVSCFLGFMLLYSFTFIFFALSLLRTYA